MGGKIKSHQLPFPTQRRRADKANLILMAGTIHQLPSRQVISAVDNNILIAD